MEIHHYTKASTLPLILSSKKFRFTRADSLDDEAEMPFASTHVDAKKFYVSSWTAAQGEHSGQWARYGDRDAGVRLTFRTTPFTYHTLDFNITRDRNSSKSGRDVGVELLKVATPFSRTTMFGNGYVIVPHGEDMRESFGGPVAYVEDPASYAKRFIKASLKETTIVGGANLARIKSPGWADQREYRFVLMAIAGPKSDYEAAPDAYETSLLDLMEERSNSASVSSEMKYIDLPFDPEALRSLEVTLGSKISSQDRDAVLHALQIHAPEATVRESSMRVR